MRRNRPQDLQPSWLSSNPRPRPPTPYPFTQDGLLRSCFLGSRDRSPPIKESRTVDGAFRHVPPRLQRRHNSSRIRKLSYEEIQRQLQQAIKVANAEIDRRPAVSQQPSYSAAREEKQVRFKLPRTNECQGVSNSDKSLEQAMANLDIKRDRRFPDRRLHCEACGRRLPESNERGRRN